MSKKVSIVFHSVCGNNYLIAKEFYKEFISYSRVRLLRINDPHLDELAKQFTIAGQYKNEIMGIEEAKVEKLFDSDLIIFAHATYFGQMFREP